MNYEVDNIDWIDCPANSIGVVIVGDDITHVSEKYNSVKFGNARTGHIQQVDQFQSAESKMVLKIDTGQYLFIANPH